MDGAAPLQGQFKEIWQQALDNFEEQNTRGDKSRRKLSERLLRDLENCNSVDTIIAVLTQRTIDAESAKNRGHAAWTEFRDIYLRPAVKVILLFNDALAELAAYFVSGTVHSQPSWVRSDVLEACRPRREGNICSIWCSAGGT